jgi:DNA mismatch endonuclease (patch repair protein)
MERQSRHETAAELALRSALHRRGLRYRLHEKVIPGLRREADVAFRSARVAVFVDGCFWHGCPEHGTTPKANRRWWRDKIEANQTRDRDTDDRLEAMGWLPVRVWEHEDVQEAAERIANAVHSRSKASPPTASGYVELCR